MALATAEDVVKALRRDLTGEEEEDLESLLDAASDLVLGHLYPKVPATPTPDGIVRVVADMVAAVLDRPKHQPQNADQLTAGEYGWKFTEGSTSGGPWLTAALKMRLRPFKGSSVVSVPLVSERFES
ncbi:hypothetical protein [Nocardia sp. NPDC049149]|uniref:hypothetical protein n=1 Tax=Nocardia sp. NPDC049149 TaxID=3364315 RepID=UPI00372241A7